MKDRIAHYKKLVEKKKKELLNAENALIAAELEKDLLESTINYMEVFGKYNYQPTIIFKIEYTNIEDKDVIVFEVRGYEEQFDKAFDVAKFVVEHLQQHGGYSSHKNL